MIRLIPSLIRRERPPSLLHSMNVDSSISTALIRMEQQDGLSIVQLLPASNEVYWSEIESASAQVTSALQGHSRPACVVDLTEMPFLGSTQVAFIVRVWKTTRDSAGAFAVACPPGLVREVLTLAGLDQLFPVCDTRAVAVARATGQWGLARREWWLAAAGISGIVMAVVGLGAGWTRGSMFVLAEGLLIAGAAMGVSSGAWLWLRSRGCLRRIGQAAVVLAVLIILTGVIVRWTRPAVAPPTSIPSPSVQQSEHILQGIT